MGRRLQSCLNRWFHRRGGPAILSYHRIAKPDVDPWGLAVSPERFIEQVQALLVRRTILSMDTFVARLRSGDLPHNAVALTFDDGYQDNLHQAKPILEATGVPATIFLATGWIGTGEEFWSDELARMVLLRIEPLSASLMLETGSLQIELPPIEPDIEPRRSWRAWDPPVTARETTYQKLWQALLNCRPERRKRAMVELRGLFGATAPNPKDLPMGTADVPRLISERISVGAHGCTHQQLTSLPPEERAAEIQRSRAEVEALSALPVTGFAYPHGDRNAETIEMVRRAGYQWACSIWEGAVDSRRAVLHDLPRIAVGDWREDMLFFKLGAIST